jgi:protein-S-isoprenylcysteine O-methyltransferase Ste14
MLSPNSPVPPALLPTPPVTPSWLVRRRTQMGLFLWLLLASALLFIHHSWPEDTFLDFSLDTLGYGFLMLGVLGRLWCTLYIGGKKHAELQTMGPYSLVRHPLYMCNLLLALGFSSLSGNPGVLVVVIAYFSWQYLATIRHEEAALLETFGAAYAAYMQRVPCFVPHGRGIDFSAPTAVDMRMLRKEVDRVLIFLLIVPILELVALLHERGMLPYLIFP